MRAKHRESLRQKLQATSKQELQLFHRTSKRRLNLEKCYKALFSINSSVVESERSFSDHTSLCMKIRSRLGNEILAMVYLLRYYFRNPQCFPQVNN